MQVPSKYSSQTRAVAEDVINNVSILVFEDIGDGYAYSYYTSGYSLINTGDETYEFRARILTSENPLKIYFVINVSNVLQGVEPGATEEEVRKAIVRDFTPAGFDSYLPMFGEEEFTDGLTDESEIEVVLVRSVARVDVINSAPDFTLSSVYIYRASDRYQVIPDALANDRVTVASIPEGTQRDVTMGPFTVNGTLFAQQVYLPESPVVSSTTDQLTATVVVIGGYITGETTETYYRMDFVPDNNPNAYGQILRNHRYVFNITSVAGPGWGGPDEAANNNSSQVTAEIKEWDDQTMDMVFDDINYFGVSSRTITVSHTAGAGGSIEVDTNLDTYLVYWLNEDGSINNTIAPIGPGGSFSNDLFTVSVAADGKRITATARTTNNTQETLSRRLLVEASRLRITLSVQQVRQIFSADFLNVFGVTGELGSLGNFVLGSSTTNPNARTAAMVSKMRNEDNFGLSGRIPIRGIAISGLGSTEISATFANLYDVIYIPYSHNPSQATVNNLLDWLSHDDKRVLFLHYDTEATNRIMFSTLGLTRVFNYPRVTTATLYDNAPTQIVNGVFGNVSSGSIYRIYDTTYGEIPLDDALAWGISPILVTGNNAVLLGINLERRIVFSGDIDLYNSVTGGQGLYPTSGSVVTNDSDILLANLWAWISEVVLGE